MNDQATRPVYSETDLKWWRAALAGEKPPIHEGQSQCGYYRRRAVKGGPWIPIQVFRDPDGLMVAMANGDPGQVDAADDMWTWLAGQPVGEGSYDHFLQHGHWPGDVPPGTIGHNLPPEDLTDPDLRLELQQLSGLAETELRSDAMDLEAGNRAANLADRVRLLRQAADERRMKEGVPHRDALAEIERKWSPLIGTAQEWLTKLSKRVEAITSAIRAARVQEAAAAVTRGEEVEMPEEVMVGGATTGRRTSGKTRKWKTAEITDWAAAIWHYREDEKVLEAVQILANKDIRSGKELSFARLKKE